MKCGEDVIISEFSQIKNEDLVVIGNHVGIDFGFYCTVKLLLEDYIHISSHVSVVGGREGFLHMKHGSALGAGSRVICTSEEFMGAGLSNPLFPEEYKDNVVCKPVVIEKFVMVTTNVVIAPGVTLGEGCVIGANSFVKKDTEPWTIYAGTPAKPLKERPKGNMLEYAEKLGLL